MDYMTMNFNRNGGGGTSDYSQLSNKPSINNVTLIGNKTASDLGLMPEYEVDDTPTESSDNLITSGGVYEADQSINGKLQGAKTVSGNPITVTDAEPMNAESVKVELEPKQDLHGYDKPWAGGAGKNKCPAYTSTETQYSVTITGNSKGEISVEGSLDRTNLYGFTLNGSISLGAGTYTMNGANPNGARLVLYDSNDNVLADSADADPSFTLESTTTAVLRMFVYANVQYDEVVRPMIRLSTESDANFEPYSNICPISGYSEVNVENNTDTYTVSLGGTKYGGILDVTSGVLTVTHGEIASYAGETLPSEWISDRDEYEAGTTPTTGAQVVYELATPSSVSTTPTDIELLENTNNISTDGTNIQLKYQPNNVIGECKAYTDEQVQKALPTPPTTDGTYHLECSVSGGIPTISWVSNS